MTKRKPKPTRQPARIAKRLALRRKDDRDHKRDLIARGLCRQCGKSRAKSPSSSRCLRCLRKSRSAARMSGHHRPRQVHRGGRPLLEWRQSNRTMDDAVTNPFAAWADAPAMSVEPAPVPVLVPESVPVPVPLQED